MSLFGELRRRNVVKVAVAYAIVGWLLIEVASTVLPTFEAPAWVLQTITFVIILGFPLAIVLSWIFDLTPQGVERTGASSESEGVTSTAGRKIDFAIIGALVLALGFVVYNYESGDAPSSSPEVVVEDVVDTLPLDVAAEQLEVLPNSVAVLPFENLSPDPDNAYFAAGIHEEVLNQLTKIRALNIIARTTMIQYAERGMAISDIAAELNVETVMEGSVRYANDRVLITAQLIDPETNAHLWSESYNREFADIFEIQADVAMNIANALEAEFSLEEQAQIEKLPTDSPEAYARFLKAQRSTDTNLTAEYLTEALTLDPNFAQAYAFRAWLAASIVRFRASGEVASVFADQARVDANRALEIDPTLSFAHMTMAVVDEALWRAPEARAGYERALALAPNHPVSLSTYANFRAQLGELDEAIVMARRALELDPSNFLYHWILGEIMVDAGDLDAALAAYENASRVDPGNAAGPVGLAFVALRRGDSEAAVTSLRLADALSEGHAWENILRPLIGLYYAQAGRRDDALRTYSDLERLDAAASDGGFRITPAMWVVADIAIGNYDAALERFIEAVDRNEPGDFQLMNYLWKNRFEDPVLDSDPRWVEARARLGFSE